jgi:hypothetical protein
VQLELTDSKDPDELRIQLDEEEVFVSLHRLRSALNELAVLAEREA